MIKVSNLCKQYKTATVLDNVTFTVPKGELFAYLGPNGAGKTTTIRILAGLTARTSGTVGLNGFDIDSHPVDAKKQCGLVTQAINLDQELTVAENLDVHGRLFHMPATLRGERARMLCAYVDLADRQTSFVKDLSGGLRRRLMLARALMHSPPILFLDEPTVGLDAGIRKKIWAIIKNIQAEGTTILLTTHYIEEAEFLADRVAFLDSGRIITIDTPEKLMAGEGTWAIDRVVDGHLDTLCYKTREAAEAFMARQKETFTIRRVNLEDAFLARTGKKVK